MSDEFCPAYATAERSGGRAMRHVPERVESVRLLRGQAIPPKAFGNWRTKKVEPQPPPGKVPYRRGDLSHALSLSLSRGLSHDLPVSAPLSHPRAATSTTLAVELITTPRGPEPCAKNGRLPVPSPPSAVRAFGARSMIGYASCQF
jgi:hypothetical protein